MNKVILIGRLTKDPEVHTTSSSITLAMFTLAVDRRFKSSNGERQADFIRCVAWRNTAEFIVKHFRKGDKIGIVGSVQTRSYDNERGQKQFVTEIVADEAYFIEGKKQAAEPEQEAPAEYDDANSNLPFDI